eukprot:90080_1
MNVDDLSRHLSNIWETPTAERDKAMELLSRIFNKILSNLSEAKYRDLNFHKIRKKFDNCRDGFYLLYLSGFKQSLNGERLQWEYNNHNLNLLKHVNHSLQQKLSEEQTKRCPNNHKLIRFRTPMSDMPESTYKCDKCAEKCPKNSLIYGCDVCNYDLCGICFGTGDNNEQIAIFIKQLIQFQINNTVQVRNNLFNKIDTKNMKEFKKLDEQYKKPIKCEKIDSLYLMNSNRTTNYGHRNRNPKINNTKSGTFDEEIINNIISLGTATREECIMASQMTDDYKDANAVYETLLTLERKCTLNTCPSLKALVIVLQKYHNLIIQNKKQLIVSEKFMDNTSILNDFHHLLRDHGHQFQEIYKLFLSKCNNSKQCKLSECVMRRRNYRDRLRLNDTELKQMYFNTNNIKDVVSQQILDTIHSHYFHSFDAGYKLSTQQKLQIEQMMDNNDEKDGADDGENILIHDRVISSIHEIINKNKCNSINSSKYVTELHSAIDLKFSFGVKYFYWDYYKNNTESVDPAIYDMHDLLQGIDDTNPGY